MKPVGALLCDRPPGTGDIKNQALSYLKELKV